MNRKYLPLILTATLLITACAGSKPMQEWRDPGYSGPIKKMLVFAVIPRSTQRRVFEDKFAETLASFDVESTTSYSLITTDQTVSGQAVDAAIKRDNLDAIMVTRLMVVDEKAEYQTPDGLEHHRSYESFFEHAMDQAGSGNWARYNNLMLETNLYDARSRRLIWSLQSESIERTLPRHRLQEQMGLTAARMAQSGMIPLTP